MGRCRSVFVLGSFFMLTSCGSGGDGNTACTTADENGPASTPHTPLQITVNGSGAMNGIFDPAPVEDGSGNLWMSYSTVNFPASPPLEITRSRIASWDAMTSTWNDEAVNLSQVAESVFQVPDGSGGMSDAIWQYEVSRVLYDPHTSNALERWKILWHRHLTVNLNNTAARLFEHGWIGLSTAPDITGPWSAEANFLVGNIYNPANNPTAGAPRFDVLSNLPSLSACQAFSEPGIISTAGGIYISVKCFTAGGGQVALLKCDHALSSCSHQGDFLTDAEVTRFSKTGQSLNGFSATELIQAAGNNYLMLTPTESDGYRGCMLFKISDLDNAVLETDACNRPKATLRLEGTAGSFNGACGYISSNQLNGIYYSEFKTPTPNFQIFESGIAPP